MNAQQKVERSQALDLEMTVVSLLRDAELLGVASPDALRPHLHLLVLAQDELARAVAKAERKLAA